ncbi:MAG: hypothetical protein NW223_05365 [Hyphomicrobiaceae bacterium]|nr:hypothetical protein [Hyphomicrobiaceae bacterium]
MSNAPDPDSKAPPFPKHRIYYVVLKWIVIVAAIVIAARIASGLIS